MSRRRPARAVVWRAALVLAGAAAFLLLPARPAAADNCDIRINPADCQNTAWTVGTVAAVAAAATAAAVAAGAVAGGVAGSGAPPIPATGSEGEGPAEGGAAGGAPAPLTDILSGDPAMEVLQQMGLVRAEVRPDGTVIYRPTVGFEDLNSGGRTSFQQVGTATDATTGQLVQVQESTITRVGGIAYNTNPDGSISSATIVVERTPPGPWQDYRQLAPGVAAQGDATFVQSAQSAYNTVAGTNAGRQIIDGIGASGNTVTIRPADPGDGNSFGASRPADRFQNADGTPGRGTGGNVYFDPNRLVAGDGSQPWHTRPPAVGLGHELAHARDAAQGNQALGQQHDPAMPRGARRPDQWLTNTRELQAASIGPFAGSTSDENAMRRELGLVNRGSYVL